MAVFQVKKYKLIKDENGNKIQVNKTKEEWNRETKNNTMTWYFSTRYKIGDKTKQYKSKLFALKREAEEQERLFLSDSTSYIKEHSKRAKISEKENNFLKSERLDDLFKEFLGYYSQYVKESTLYCTRTKFKKHLTEYISELSITELTFNKTKEIHEKIDAKELSIATKNTIHSVLVEFFEYLKKKGLIEQNYAKSYGSFQEQKELPQKEKSIRFQTLEEFELFLSVVDDEFWKIFFKFGFWHGCRKGEQRALYIEDIDFEKELVNFNKTFTRDKNGHEVIGTIKNGKSGKIYLYEECIEDLKKLVKQTKLLEGYSEKWFLFGGPFKISKNMIDRKLEYYYKKAKEKYPDRNITVLTYHEFARHSHATYLYTIGKDNPNIVQLIAERLRDTSETIKKIYVHNTEVTGNKEIKELLKKKGGNVT